MRTTSASFSHPQQNASNKRLLTNQWNGIFDIQIQNTKYKYTKVCIAQIASSDCHSQSKLRFSCCSSFICPFLQFIVPHPILPFCFFVVVCCCMLVVKKNKNKCCLCSKPLQGVFHVLHPVPLQMQPYISQAEIIPSLMYMLVSYSDSWPFTNSKSFCSESCSVIFPPIYCTLSLTFIPTVDKWPGSFYCTYLPFLVLLYPPPPATYFHFYVLMH